MKIIEMTCTVNCQEENCQDVTKVFNSKNNYGQA